MCYSTHIQDMTNLSPKKKYNSTNDPINLHKHDLEHVHVLTWINGSRYMGHIRTVLELGPVVIHIANKYVYKH